MKQRTRRARQLASLIVGVALVASACGGNSATPERTGSSTPQDTESSQQSAASSQGNQPPAGEARNSSATSRETDGAAVSVPVLLPFPPDVTYTPVYVGPATGLFGQNGIKPDFQVGSGSGTVVQQVLAGNVKFGVASSGADIAGAAKSPDLRVFSCHDPGNVYQISAINPDIKSVTDLKGKALGYTDAAGGEVPMVKAALKSAGIKDSDISLIAIGEAIPSVLNALKSGTVDAYATGFQAMVSLKAAGADGLHNIMPEELRHIPSSCMIALKSTLANEKLRDQAIALATGWNESFVFAKANPDAAIQITCKAAPEKCANKNIQDDLLSEGLAAASSGDPKYPYGLVDPKTWANAAEIFKAAGTYTGTVNIDQLTDGDLVQQIQKAANDYDRDAVVALADGWK